MLNSLALALLSVAAPPSARDATIQNATIQNSWTIHAGHVYTSRGEVLENAVIEVVDGRISALWPGRSAPDGALKAAAVTAGMIDLSPRMAASQYSVEQSKEVQPALSVASAIDLWDPRWEDLARRGVTTVLVAPLDRNVISGYAIALKTSGPRDLALRKLEAKPVLRGSMGSDPSSGNHPAFGRPTDFYARRPTTRMGVEWEWRKALFDAVAATRDPERDFPGAADLRAVLAGETLLCIQAWATQDIRTAVYLKEEMAREGLGNIQLFIDAAAEAWKEPDFLTRTSTPVILPPARRGGRTNEGAFMALDSAKVLVDLGLVVCLSAHGSTRLGEDLAAQAGLAVRGGLEHEAALAAVTSNPARLIGIDGRVGAIAAGLDADLVLWNGTPFELSTRVVGVLAAGELVLDPRATDD